MDRLGLQVACEADEQTDNDVTPWVVVNVAKKHCCSFMDTVYRESTECRKRDELHRNGWYCLCGILFTYHL